MDELKPREPRRKVVLSARMRVGATWGDVCILDMSSRGLLIQGSSAPPRGSYLEVRRGRHVIVARVVWAQDHRFGVSTQDRLNVDAIASEPGASASGADGGAQVEVAAERRAADRKPASSSERHESSRMLSNSLEFACVAGFGLAAAAMVFEAVGEVLTRPLSATATALRH